MLIKFWYILVLVIILLFIPKFCLNKNDLIQNEKIKLPEKKGSISKPVAIINHKSKKDSIKTLKGNYIYTENPINKKLADDLIEALKNKDSLQILKLYLKSIEEKEQSRIFYDKNQSIEVYTKYRGDILDQKILNYKIKERDTLIKPIIKETKFAVYIGSSLNYTKELKLTPSANVGVQISNRLILTGSYSLDKSYQAGILYKLKL